MTIACAIALLALLPIAVLAFWAVVVGRNRGLFGDGQNDDYPISRHKKEDRE